MSGKHDPFPTNLMRHCMKESGFNDPRDWLLFLIKTYKTAKGTAIRLGVSYPTVESWCRCCKINLPCHKNKPHYDYDTSLSPKEMMRKYNICYKTAVLKSKNKRKYKPREKGAVDGSQRKAVQAPSTSRGSSNKVS